MGELETSDFPAFFEAIHKYPPMDWQVRLAELACRGDWPAVIDLPTGAGKTSCLEMASFALAFQADRPPELRTAPLRTFLVVDRRIVVDDAFRRARYIQENLAEALAGRRDSVLARVAERLATISGNRATPLIACQLRGGVYRDTSWARSPNQPLLVTSTVDQVGSRLLFRGYGVTESARPIHAALVACDSLILLDEAHCSKAFSQTLSAIRRFQAKPWQRESFGPPSISVEMTATPAGSVSGEQRFELTSAERSDRHSFLGRRLHTPKPAELRVAAKAKGKRAVSAFAGELVSAATELLSSERTAVAVVVNRIATAKEVYGRLRQELAGPAQVEMMIGRMRAIDRNKQADRLRKMIACESQESRPSIPLVVVATQCIEVGADLDFDAMVTEAAPLDALRQRFGRLNRTARSIDARGIVVIQEQSRKTDQQLDALDSTGKHDDPVYGNALARTWNALWQVGEGNDAVRQLDFGIAAMDAVVTRLGDDEALARLNTSSPDAPTLLPAHLDLLCQTAPAPWPDPDVSLWLHGAQRANPDVQVCWREDLPQSDWDDSCKAAAWIQAVSLCPPSSLECMPVPISRMKTWLVQQEPKEDSTSDVPAAATEPTDPSVNEITASRQPLVWRGGEASQLLTHIHDIRPGDTIVLPVSAGGWNELGFLPGADAGHLPAPSSDTAVDQDRAVDQVNAVVDVAEEACLASRRRRVLRLFPARLRALPDSSAGAALMAFCQDESSPLSLRDVRKLVLEMCDESECYELRDVLRQTVAGGFSLDRYSGYDGKIAQEGIVLTSFQRGAAAAATEIVDDDGIDGLCDTLDGRVALADHLADVEKRVVEIAQFIDTGTCLASLRRAARMHDWGKCDPRFQAMLMRRDLQAAYSQPHLWAKSTGATSSRRDWQAVRKRAGLPPGFRHEFLSVQLAERALEEADQADDDCDRQLVLHLIASHHGYARPFAPVCNDEQPVDVQFETAAGPIKLSCDWRGSHRPERLDSGIAERYWATTRRFGWWGVAYLEAILRLADQDASANPNRVVGKHVTTSEESS